MATAKTYPKTPGWWAGLSIALVFVAVRFERAASYDAPWWGWVSLAAAAVAIALCVAAFVVFARRGLGIISVLALVAGVFMLLAIPAGRIHRYRLLRAIDGQIVMNLHTINTEIQAYVTVNRHLPPAASWCDALTSTRDAFSIGQLPAVECVFAFNENVSGRIVEDLDPRTVLLVETEGRWNGHGGRELLDVDLTKFNYFLRGRPRSIHLLLVDGAVVKYRVPDGAMAECQEGQKPGNDGYPRFGPFHKPSDPEYKPLYWK